MINPSMLDSPAVALTLRTLAGKVRQGDPEAADRLALLSEAVEKKTSADVQLWTSTDISKVIDPESIVEHYKHRQMSSRSFFLDTIEMFRNVLIFVPIVVTWLGISQATSSYNDYISAALASHNQDELSQPFLYLWQQGFGGRLNAVLALSNVALIDVGVLALVITLTLLAYGLLNANRLKEEEKANQLYMDLVHAIARSTLVLNMTKQSQPAPSQQPSLLGGPTTQLDLVVQEIQIMAKDIMTTFTTIENDLTRRMDGMIDTFTQRFSKITDDLSKQLQQSTLVYGSLGKTTTSLQQLSKDMSTAAQNIVDTNKDLLDGVNKLMNAMSDLAQQQGVLLQTTSTSVSLLQDSSNLLTNNVTELQGIASQQASWNSELTVSLGEVRIASEVMRDQGVQFGGFVSQLSMLVTDMRSDHVAQRQLAESMAESMRSTQDIQNYLKDLAISFRQLAVDTNDMLGLYRGLPKNMTSDMVDAIRTIEKGGNDLSDAAQSFFSVSQFLEKVVLDQEQVVDWLKASNKI